MEHKNKGSTVGTTLVVAFILAALVAMYEIKYPTAPDPTPKDCLANEVKLWADGWYCVVARKP